ncbi:hypothetical protein BCR33DRAFT_717527 [Rhizoclosmatium globosum]|uniref:BHLH domain-containing protein n=1 Tax=Rhizoclosmatium globosum TaxID=329046 RepID=A0A1Y2C8U5_9FUNG|nr:hypothetical protein BCR33DRAFT_717527 [Rhizoclosmatium globosum]|eukprot:ORY43284.1 hypothetical protein BCR33DRAFT_717527 [Rhizoclosmatium globosum]
MPSTTSYSTTTPNSTTTTTTLTTTTTTKKQAHVLSERQRRARVKDLFKELSLLVPNLLPPMEGCSGGVIGSSRIQILDGVSEYITGLKDRIRVLKEVGDDCVQK